MNTDPTQDAHSLGIALRLAQAQIRDLRKANNQLREALETAARRFIAPEFCCDWQDAADEIHDLLAESLMEETDNKGEQP